jgi:anti-sigma-K factor RskA
VVRNMRDNLHLLAGGYVLDALSDPERDSFERHLQTCASCDAEIRGFRETAARLGLARAADPPPAMRQHVLAAAYRTRQLPPLPAGSLDRAARRGRLVRLVFSDGTHQSPARPRRRVPRLMTAAVAAAAAAGIAFGVVSQVSTPPATSTAISSVLGARDALTETMATSAGGQVTAVVSWDQREAVVTTTGLASLPSAQVYQLWVMGPAGTTQARSAGLLAHAGHTGPVLAAGLRPGERIGITVEPAGGTSQPTTPPVVVMALPA